MTHKYRLKIDTDALLDIQEATDWYNKQMLGLVFAVVHTSRNPKIWEERRMKYPMR